MSTPTTLNENELASMRELYRTVHAMPELSMQEHETAALIESELSDLGVESFRCGGTGVVGIQRNGDGPTVAFRADIDGLPIAEATGLPYASTRRGTMPDGSDVPVMHGCGHDAHIASAFGAIRYFSAHTDDWSGTIVWIFQPGEETAEGARAMVDDGLWDRAGRPDVVYGQHIGTFRAGRIRLASGNATSMADSWEVTLHGTQAHASRPHTGVDPIVLGAHIILRIQSVVAREVDALHSAVVTVGTFHAGLKENIMPGSATFTLNVRTVDQSVREGLLASLRRVITAEALASGAPEPTIRELYTFPRLYNDPTETDALQTRFASEFGDDLESGSLSMGSEDFGHLSDSIGVPCVFWRYGSLSEADAQRQAAGENVPSNHSPEFAPEPESLQAGARACIAALMSKVAR